MSLEAMKAKTKIAKALHEQSALVFAYRVHHFSELSLQQRLELKDAARKLNARADEVLEDALEEGAAHADVVLEKLKAHTQSLKGVQDDLDKISSVLEIAAKVAKAAAGVVSGGLGKAIGLL